MIEPIQAGAARKLTQKDIADAAMSLGVDVPTIKAVIKVESSGNGFDARNRPTILFEPHVFYRNLDGDNLQKAIMLGLAYPRWGTRPYPRGSDAQYVRLEQARQISNERAFRSVSIGLGQILGENFAMTGHRSAAEMFVSACHGEREQLMQMVNFIKTSRLGQYLRNRNWAGFAAGYNGPGFRKNSYDTKLADAYRRAKLG